MKSITVTLILVLLSYIVGNWAFRVNRIPKFPSIFIYGLEFIILGIVIGPKGFNILNFYEQQFIYSPVALMLCFAGLMFGLQFRIKNLKLISFVNYRVAIIQSIITFFTTVVLFSPFYFWKKENLFVILILSSISSISAPTIISAVTRRYRSHGNITRTLRYVTSFDSLVGLILFAGITSFYKPTAILGHNFASGFAWFLIAISTGVLLGLFYHVFMALRLNSNERLAMAIGMITLTAGISFVLKISPLFVSFIAGLILTNFSDQQDKLFRLLISAEKPFYALMLISIGTYFTGFNSFILILGLAFFVLRLMAKMSGSFVAFNTFGLTEKNSFSIGLALSGQGGMAIAFVLDFISRYPDNVSILLTDIVIIGFVLNNLITHYFVKKCLLIKKEI